MARSSHDALREAAQALDAGYITRAASTLAPLRPAVLAPADSALRDSLQSDCLLLGGDNSAALEFASRVSTNARAPLDALARAFLVRAVLAADAGQSDQTLDFAERTRQYASRSSNHVLRARAETRLIAALSDCMSVGQAAASVQEAYALVHNSGDPATTAYLHAVHAMLAGRRGQVRPAWRHLDIAGELLAYAKTPIVQAMTLLTSMVIVSLEDDHPSTVAFGQRALDLCLKVGYLRLVPRIQSNLGLALIRTGKVDEARILFDSAASHRLSLISRVGVCDSRAQLSLLLDDHDECERLLTNAFGYLSDQSNRYVWYRLGVLETLVHLKLARCDADAAERAHAAKRLADEHGHRNYSSTFAVLEARAHCALGDVDAAQAAAGKISFPSGDTALTTIGQREATFALIHALSNQSGSASLHMGRAQRILSTIGTALHCKDLTKIVASTTRSGACACSSDASDSIESAGFLVECSAHPEVLAREAVAQLVDSQPIVSAVLVRSSEDGETVPLRLIGNGDPDRAPDFEIAVGTLRGTRHSLRAWTSCGDVSNRSRIVARIAEAAAFQRDSDREQEDVDNRSSGIRSFEIDGVFDAPAMKTALNMVDRVAPTPMPVLLLGETGTGKEVIARVLHERSARSRGPFVPFNCATIPSDLLDSQLFGHVRGAFTGAVGDSLGVVRAADGGTLFLDEIGDMPLIAQPKLLRFLERGEVHPVGAARPTGVDVRIVAATNSNLYELVQQNKFRADLYFRLNGVSISIPPLRDRREDIPALARLFLGRFAATMGRPTPVLSPAAVELLQLRSWPGNVRQLSNEMRRLAALTDPGQLITADALDGASGQAQGHEPFVEAAPKWNVREYAARGLTLDAATRRLEREMIEAALREANGLATQAAELLGLSRKGLFLKRKRLGLD